MKAVAILLAFLPVILCVIVFGFQRWKLHEERKERSRFEQIMRANQPGGPS